MAKERGLTFSKKHGLNPSIMICPICGKDMCIACFGRLKGDAEAPKQIQADSPCDECNKEYLTLVECEESKKPTGRRMFIKRETVKDELREHDFLAISVVDFTKIAEQIK